MVQLGSQGGISGIHVLPTKQGAGDGGQGLLQGVKSRNEGSLGHGGRGGGVRVSRGVHRVEGWQAREGRFH